ncbi:MAG: nicotinate-nucleotide adenylyltransferase [Muribaculaceae bacterium]|nr:nicotinate-nucleotide adenylyltransferase [Muribaculaceae bacterium]
MNIVVFGGSFNPVHTGHAMMASVVASLNDVDEVWMMVSPQNPLKISKELMDENDRFRLVKMVADISNSVVASDFEFTLSRPSYTYKTLKALKENFPEHNFKLLIGSDNWKDFNLWRDTDKIIKEFGVIIYQRPDVPVSGPFPEGVRLLDNVPMMLISSTYIREALKQGRDVRFMVPDIIYDELKNIHDYGK